MNRNYFIVAIILLMSCGTAKSKKDVPGIENKSSPHGDIYYDMTLRGLYYADQEKWKVLACDSLTPFPVKDYTGKMDAKYKTMVSEFSYGIEPVYIRVNGTLTIKNTDTLFTIKEIDSVQQVNFNTHCLPFTFIALGNEPFWNLQIIPLMHKMIFKSPSETKEFAYRGSTREGDKTMYESLAASGERLTIIIQKQNCGDGMSNRQYHYSAQINLGNKTFIGCAIKKGDRFSDAP